MFPCVRYSGFHVAQQSRRETRRNVAIRTSGLNTECIGVMRAMPVLLKWCGHLMARRAEGFCGSVVKTTQRCRGGASTQDECQQPSDREAKQEPTLGASPKPRGEARALGGWCIQCQPFDAVLSRKLYTLHCTTRCAVANRRGSTPLVKVNLSRHAGRAGRRSVQKARFVINSGNSHDFESKTQLLVAFRGGRSAHDRRHGMSSDLQDSDSNAAIRCGNRPALRGVSRASRRWP